MFSATGTSVFVDSLPVHLIQMVIPPSLSARWGAELDLLDARSLNYFLAAVPANRHGRLGSFFHGGTDISQTVALAVAFYGRKRNAEGRCDIGIAAVLLTQLTDLKFLI